MTSESPGGAASPARTWNRGFRDRALEREYQAVTADATRRSYRYLTVLALLAWILLFLLDRETAGSPANFRALLAVRYGFGLPIAIAATLLGWTSVETFRRYKDAGVAALIVANLGSAFVMAQVVPEPQLFDAASGAPASMAASVAIACLLAIWAVRFDLVVIIQAGCTLGGVLHVRRYPSLDPGIFLYSLATTIAVGIVVFYLIDRAKRDAFMANRALARERERSERLLANMLPDAIAVRLKTSPGRIAEHHGDATVLFCDLSGFTSLSARLSPVEVVDMLDEIFTVFDEIAARHGLEKIKTIGDAYMVVGGVPTPRKDHAVAVARMALEMREVLATRQFAGGRTLQARIGIDTGPVVAGVIGTSKYSYDLWGDTVNTASRMESHGAPGQIHVSEACRVALADQFQLEERGLVDIKGKGPMRTWWLTGRPAVS